jgi:glycosyltransferase involved in cell wall biosynthesis
VYLKARKNYLNYFKGKVDVVIDEINTIPFFTPLYVKEKKLALIHQLAREFWFYETKFPLSIIGYAIEPRYLKLYKDIPTLTVSNSTKQDLIELGFKEVFIIPEGLNHKHNPKSIYPKEKNFTLIFVGRLKRAKLPDHAIKAFNIVKKQIPEARLWIVGDGYLKSELQKIAGDGITFFGKVSEKEKYELMSRAHALIVPGVREGWGLVVIEANSVGTPAIGYNVHGLRDSIRDGENGLLVKQNSPEAMAKAIMKLYNDEKLRNQLSENALEYAKQFSWDKSAEEFEKVVEGVVGEG